MELHHPSRSSSLSWFQRKGKRRMQRARPEDVRSSWTDITLGGPATPSSPSGSRPEEALAASLGRAVGAWIAQNLVRDLGASSQGGHSQLHAQLCAALAEKDGLPLEPQPQASPSQHLQDRLLLDALQHMCIGKVTLLMACLGAWRSCVTQTRTARHLDKEEDIRGTTVCMAEVVARQRGAEVMETIQFEQQVKMPAVLFSDDSASSSAQEATLDLLRCSFAYWRLETQHMVVRRELREQLSIERAGREAALKEFHKLDLEAMMLKETVVQDRVRLDGLLRRSLRRVLWFMVCACFRLWARVCGLRNSGSSSSHHQKKRHHKMHLLRTAWQQWRFQVSNVASCKRASMTLVNRWLRYHIYVLGRRALQGWRYESHTAALVREATGGVWPSRASNGHKPVRLNRQNGCMQSKRCEPPRTGGAHQRGGADDVISQRSLAICTMAVGHLMLLAFLALRMEAVEQRQARRAWEDMQKQSLLEEALHEVMEVLQRELVRTGTQVAELSRTASRGPAGSCSAVMTTKGPVPAPLAFVIPRNLCQWMGATAPGSNGGSPVPYSNSAGKRAAVPKVVEHIISRISELTAGGERLKAVVAKGTRMSAAAEAAERHRPLELPSSDPEDAVVHGTAAEAVAALDCTLSALIARCPGSNGAADDSMLSEPAPEPARLGESITLLGAPRPIAVCQYPGQGVGGLPAHHSFHLHPEYGACGPFEWPPPLDHSQEHMRPCGGVVQPGRDRPGLTSPAATRCDPELQPAMPMQLQGAMLTPEVAPAHALPAEELDKVAENEHILPQTPHVGELRPPEALAPSADAHQEELLQAVSQNAPPPQSPVLPQIQTTTQELDHTHMLPTYVIHDSDDEAGLMTPRWAGEADQDQPHVDRPQATQSREALSTLSFSRSDGEDTDDSDISFLNELTV